MNGLILFANKQTAIGAPCMLGVSFCASLIESLFDRNGEADFFSQEHETGAIHLKYLASDVWFGSELVEVGRENELRLRKLQERLHDTATMSFNAIELNVDRDIDFQERGWLAVFSEPCGCEFVCREAIGEFLVNHPGELPDRIAFDESFVQNEHSPLNQYVSQQVRNDTLRLLQTRGFQTGDTIPFNGLAENNGGGVVRVLDKLERGIVKVEMFVPKDFMPSTSTKLTKLTTWRKRNRIQSIRKEIFRIIEVVGM